MKQALALALACTGWLSAETVQVPGLEKQVEILRDRWGVPHIYASTVHDLFFAQGYITARDRLFQIDLWRRTGTGNLRALYARPSGSRCRPSRVVETEISPSVTESICASGTFRDVSAARVTPRQTQHMAAQLRHVRPGIRIALKV